MIYVAYTVKQFNQFLPALLQLTVAPYTNPVVCLVHIYVLTFFPYSFLLLYTPIIYLFTQLNVKRNLVNTLIIKPTRCNNFSNLFLE